MARSAPVASAAPERLLGLLRAERDDDDLAEARLGVGAVLGQAEGGLERVLVEGVRLPLEAGRLDLAAGGDLDLVRVVGVGDPLEGDEDLHGSASTVNGDSVFFQSA